MCLSCWVVFNPGTLEHFPEFVSQNAVLVFLCENREKDNEKENQGDKKSKGS